MLVDTELATKEVSTMEKDPVCGMDVDVAQAAGTSEYKGKTHYFCSKSCKVAFDKDPEKYLSAESSHEGGHH